MRLIDLDEKYNIILEPEVFLLKDFKELRDSRKDPELLIKEIGYLYFFYSIRSEFQHQTDLEQRHKDVLERVGLPKKWKPDEKFKRCVEVYKYLCKTISATLLETAYQSVDKLKAQLNAIDLNERDDKGKPIWNLKQYADTSKLIPELMENIQQCEKTFIKGEEEASQMRGNKIKTLYEEGFGNIK